MIWFIQWFPYTGVNTAILPHQWWVPYLLARRFAPHSMCSWFRWQLCRLTPGENIPGIGASWCQPGVSHVRTEPGSRLYSHLLYITKHALKIVSWSEICWHCNCSCLLIIAVAPKTILFADFAGLYVLHFQKITGTEVECVLKSCHHAKFQDPTWNDISGTFTFIVQTAVVFMIFTLGS
jgi:hypothetical protein